MKQTGVPLEVDFEGFHSGGATRPCRFGLVRPMTSYNLLVVEFDHWRTLWRDLRTATSVGDGWAYLFKPLGWRRDGLGATPGRDAGELNG